MNKEWFNLKDISITDKLSDKNMLYDLQRLLDEELAKPLEERDLDAVKDITDAIVGINDEEIPKPVGAEGILAEVSARKKRGRIVQLRRWAAVISACFAVCIALNFYTLRTYGYNVVETLIKAVSSGFSVDLSHFDDQLPLSPATTATTVTTDDMQSVTTVTVTTIKSQSTMGSTEAETTEPITTTRSAGGGTPSVSADPLSEALGNSAEAAEPVVRAIWEASSQNGMEVCYPTYIPLDAEGLELTDSSSEQLKDSKDLYFTFSNGEKTLDLIIEEYISKDLMPEAVIPSDKMDYYLMESADYNGFIIFEDESNTALFVYGNTVYTLHTRGFDRSDIRDIAENFVPFFTGSSEK